jgi:hypothetical protein
MPDESANRGKDVGFRFPFGEESCEHEIQVLHEYYPDYFYDQSRFNAESLDPNVYLIVGRRGSGKTSLTKYFNFQKQIPNAHSIDVNEPEVYHSILQKIAGNAYMAPDLVVTEVVRIWEFLIWSLIFDEYSDRDPVIARAKIVSARQTKPAYLIQSILNGLISKYADDSGAISNALTASLSDGLFSSAIDKVLEIAQREPVIVAVDTFERYDRENLAIMAVTAALVQSANNFNIAYADHGIHVKAFVSAEVFPHLKEAGITNTTKFIRYPIYLYWKPRDLIRLISWRFYRYLEAHGWQDLPAVVHWEDFDDVHTKLWVPFFGERTTNKHGGIERCFPYVLRHTQMRPRQLVVLCNAIAHEAQRQECFPLFKRLSIASVIGECERDLANEVLNSYARIYPNVAEIVDALQEAPSIFPGNYLDKVAPSTAFAWPNNEYAPASFRRLITELGIVGKVRSRDEKSGTVAADFEYTMSDRLTLRTTDECVIHPMFYSKLNTIMNEKLTVYPFPDHEDFNRLGNPTAK